MKKRNIVLITGLMALALMGVIAMQYYFLRQSYRLQSELFDRSVNEALNNVVSKVSKQDALNFLNDKVKYQNHLAAMRADSAAKHKNGLTVYTTAGNEAETLTDDGLIHVPINKSNPARNQRIAKLRDSLKKMLIQRKLEQEIEDIGGSYNFQVRIEQYTNENGQVEQYITSPQIVNKVIDPSQARSVKRIKPKKYIDTLYYPYNDPQFGRQILSLPRLNPLWVQEQERARRERQLKQVQKLLQVENANAMAKPVRGQESVFKDLAQEYQRTDEPLKERINQIWIDTLLRFELNNRGIYLPFSYEVTKANNDSVIFSKAVYKDGQKPVFLGANTYQMPIFSKEVIADPGKLWVYFPQKNSMILSRMTGAMATTGGLLFFFIFCFGFIIYSILRQKKISEMKTDFINNMTHEFKTPVSTIMIASEALRDAEIAADKSRVAKLANIIYDENVRLGSHIERVLNIARIEKNDFKLDIKKVEINEMIAAVLDSMALRLQKHQVKLDLNLSEEELFIKADELHFSNVIYNLIDNAIKYSRETPEINIITIDKGNQVIIKVTDKGIGMSSDQLAKIFEQFYRVPTGNLHDVKGFGLGLSYVSTIVKRLNGSIGVKSEKDKGSEFELKFDKIAAAKA